MAVTIQLEPSLYTPASNQQIFVASSTNVAQPNFSYIVEITDLTSGDNQFFNIASRPSTGECLFDARPWAEKYMTNYIPMNLYGWQQSDSVRRIEVNIGESFGATKPYTYTPGPSYSYNIWNASLPHTLHGEDYDRFLYLYDAQVQQFNYLTGSEREYTYEDKSHYIYALTQNAGDFEELYIITYDAAGSVIGVSQVPNPYEALTNYQDKYICIDVGHKGLTQIASGDVTGVYPIITSNVAYYEIYDNSTSITPAQANLTLIKTLYIGDEPKYDVYVVHYLSRLGDFRTLAFPKRSTKRVQSSKTTYKVNPNQYSNNYYNYTADSPYEKVMSSSSKGKLTLESDWMTPAQVEQHKDIIDSPIIYLDRGSDLNYVTLICTDSEYVLNQNTNQKLYSLAINFEYGHEDFRQRT